MSQIHFHYRDLRITTGWDRPLQTFFLTVEGISGSAIPGVRDADQPLYCNLDDTDLHQGRMALWQVIDVLERFGVPRLDRLVSLLTQHQENNAGNVVVNLGTIVRLGIDSRKRLDMSDSALIQYILHFLDGKPWSADTLDDIARLLRQAGYTIRDLADEQERTQ